MHSAQGPEASELTGTVVEHLTLLPLGTASHRLCL